MILDQEWKKAQTAIDRLAEEYHIPVFQREALKKALLAMWADAFRQGYTQSDQDKTWPSTFERRGAWDKYAAAVLADTVSAISATNMKAEDFALAFAATAARQATVMLTERDKVFPPPPKAIDDLPILSGVSLGSLTS